MNVADSRGLLRSLRSAIPNALVLGCLLGALYWGHTTHWSFSGHEEAAEASEGPIAATTVSAKGNATQPQSGANSGQVAFDSPDDVKKAGLAVGLVEQRPMDEFVVANGIVSYDQTRIAQLSVRVPGIVWRVEKQVGEKVQKGDVLVLLDSVDVGKAKAEFLQSVVNHDLKQKNLQRMRSISDSIPERAVREAESQVRESRVRLFNAQQTLLNLGMPIDFAEIEKLNDEQLTERMQFLGLPRSIASTLDPKTTTANLIPLVAPFKGVVIGREIVVGEVVEPTQKQFTLADVSKVWITLNVDREDAARLDIGQEIRFLADGVDREVVSKVSWISTEVDQKTKTVQVRAEVENPRIDDDPDTTDGQRLLRANTFGTGKICVNPRPRAVAVPGAAVQTIGRRRMVFVPLSDGRTFVPRDVRTGVTDGGFTEILSGVAAGDQIVTTGSYMLKSELFGAVQ